MPSVTAGIAPEVLSSTVMPILEMPPSTIDPPSTAEPSSARKPTPEVPSATGELSSQMSLDMVGLPVPEDSDVATAPTNSYDSGTVSDAPNSENPYAGERAAQSNLDPQRGQPTTLNDQQESPASQEHGGPDPKPAEVHKSPAAPAEKEANFSAPIHSSLPNPVSVKVTQRRVNKLIWNPRNMQTIDGELLVKGVAEALYPPPATKGGVTLDLMRIIDRRRKHATGQPQTQPQIETKTKDQTEDHTEDQTKNQAENAVIRTSVGIDAVSPLTGKRKRSEVMSSDDAPKQKKASTLRKSTSKSDQLASDSSTQNTSGSGSGNSRASEQSNNHQGPVAGTSAPTAQKTGNLLESASSTKFTHTVGGGTTFVPGSAKKVTIDPKQKLLSFKMPMARGNDKTNEYPQ